MSYVIQNFHTSPKNLILTPRIKLKIINDSFSLFLIFLKFQSFFFFKKNINLEAKEPLFFFLRFFFQKSLFKRLFFFNKKYYFNYTNNFTKSLLYWNFKLLSINYENRYSLIPKLNETGSFMINWYYKSIKNCNLKTHNKFYKNFFSYIFIFYTHPWLQFSLNFNFYLSFVLVHKHFKILKIYNGYFFKIYNF